MEIKILGGNGLHASETRAVRLMERHLRSSWFGYASLLVVDDKGSMDVDTLIFTHDRVLLIELKEWTGKLESSEGRWYLNGGSRGKSAYDIKRVQAIRISRLLEQELKHKLGYFPKVEAHVVLCGSANPDNLSTTERRFVHTLDKLLTISDATAYGEFVEAASIAYTDLFDKLGKPRPNSQSSKPIFQQFFTGNRIRPKEFSHYNYTAEPNAWFKHRKGLFTEYKGHHQEVANEISLMRRWDFNSLGVGNATQDRWAKIALRESRVFLHAKGQERGLEEYLLRPLLPFGTDDVTEDFTELYELRRTFQRLDEYLNKAGKAQNAESRLDTVRALIVPFAELHTLGIAHRDIDLHNLWQASDQKSVLVSGFAASFFPERGTVSDLREMLQGSHIRLPEDVLRVDGDILDPFRQDVFMLAAAAYRVCFPASTLPRDDQGIWQWSKPADDSYGGKLDDWFQTALSWDPADRFPNATAMLASLNDAIKPTAPTEEEAASAWQAVSDGDFIKRGWGPFHIFSQFPPDQGENPGAGQVLKYRCTIDGVAVYLKFWQQVSPNPATHGLNRRVAAFRARAEKVGAGGIPTPALHSLGLLESGGLFVVTKMEQGELWRSACDGTSPSDRRVLAMALLKAVMVLHEQQIGHGDIHPENLLVVTRSSKETIPLKVLLLDLLDYGEKTQPFNIEYGPPNPASADAFARDRYALYRLVGELLCDDVDDQVRTEIATGLGQPLGLPVSLVPLHDEVQRLLRPNTDYGSEADQEPITISVPRLAHETGKFMLELDDGCYHVNCKWDKRNDVLLNCYVTGINGCITFVIDPEQRQLRDVRVTTPIALSELVSASNKSAAVIQRQIQIVQSAELGDGHSLILDAILNLDPVLSLLEAKFSPPETKEYVAESDGEGVSTEELWRTLLQTERESQFQVEVVGPVDENRNGQLKVPYRTADGRSLDFEGDDRVFVSVDDVEDSQLALLDLNETTLDELILDVTRNDAKKMVARGAILRLESLQSKASRDRKAKAMERVLERASVIPNLVNYFDVDRPATTQDLAARPTGDRVRALYDLREQKLNTRQVDAFEELVQRGPVGVLQGPPGTGKTTFVGAFIHYLFSELGVRNVLLVGQSHTAVDAVAKKARAVCQQHAFPLSVVRMGQERMIATEMLDAHSRGIQRQLRHSFHREYEHRIQIFSDRLGLSTGLTAEVAALHRTLDGIFSSIRRYGQELEAAMAENADAELKARADEIRGQRNEVMWLAERIVYQRFPDHAAAILTSENPWDEILTLVCDLHDVNNPSAISRLRSLLSLSQEWLSVLRAGQANYDQFLVQTRQLVCGTLVGMGQKHLGVSEVEFDWVIVDEAARAQASELMIPLQSGRRILLVGDHRQLPPVYEPAHVRAVSKRLGISEDRIRKTDFERAFRTTGGVTLNTQYRMVEPISDLVSHCFYKEDGVDLLTGRGDSLPWYGDLPYPLNIPVAWIDSGAGQHATGEEDRGQGKYANVQEGRLVMRLLQRLTAPHTVANLREKANGAFHPIGVITMYRAQKQLLEKELSKAEWAGPIRSLVRIDTVDSYQGQENPFVILSLVRDNPRENQGFMWDPSRINVSLSRAQERLAVIGAARMWRGRNRADPLGRVLRFVEERTAAQDGRYTVSGELSDFASPQAFEEGATSSG